jgi:hypothetical protein
MRKHRTKEEWLALIMEQKESGVSAVEFCRKKNIHPNLFYKKRKENNPGKFVKIPLPASVSSGIKIKIQDVIIEPGSHTGVDELKGILHAVMEVLHDRF